MITSQISSLDIVVSSLYETRRLGKDELSHGQMHLIPFFLQYKFKHDLSLDFSDMLGPYSPEVQSSLGFAKDVGIIEVNKQMSNPCVTYYYKLTPSGEKYFNKVVNRNIEPIKEDVDKSIEEIIHSDFADVLKMAYALWDEDLRIRMGDKVGGAAVEIYS